MAVPAAQGGAGPPIIPPPKARPQPRPRVVVQAPTAPPIILSPAPAPSSQQVAAAHYAATPHQLAPVAPMPSSLPPQIRGHWVTDKQGQPVLIHAVGKNQWAQGPAPGYPSPARNIGLPSPGDVAGGGYDFAQANAFKQTPAYKQAVLDVFTHQSPHQRQAIVSGALGVTQRYRNQPEKIPPESKMILDYVRKTGGGPTGGSNLVPAAIYANVVRAGLPNPTGLEKIIVNAAKDVVNYPSMTLQGIYQTAKEGIPAVGNVMEGNPGAALPHALNLAKQFGGPIVQTIEHPIASFEAHPVYTAQMLWGLKSFIGKGAGATMRSGALGGAAESAASTAREPLSYGTVSGEPTPSPLAEERSYSKDIFNKAAQVAREKYIRSRGRNPNIARPTKPRLAPPGFNLGQEAKLRRVGNEMASVQQTLQRAERNRSNAETTDAQPAKGGGKLRRPDVGAANLVTHVLQGVIQGPETAVADVTSEIERLNAARTQARSQNNIWNKTQVRDLSEALKTPAVDYRLPDGTVIKLPEAIAKAIASAEQLRPTLHAQDAILAEHRILTPEEIDAKYFPYAQKWMGAIYDHSSGRWMVPHVPTHTPADLRAAEQQLKEAIATERQVKTPSGRQAAQRVRAQAQQDVQAIRTDLSTTHRELPTDEIQRHLADNGVPDPAYVGHYKDKIAPGQYYMRYVKSRGTLSRGKRTGEAFRLGGYDHTYEGLRGQMAARAQAVTKAGIHDRLVQRSYLKPRELVEAQVRDVGRAAAAKIKANPEQRAQIVARTKKEVASLRTGMYTQAEAEKAIHAQPRDDFGNLMPSEVEMTPIRAAPAKSIDWVRDLQNPMKLHSITEIEQRALKRAIDEAKDSSNQARNIVLAPKTLVDQLTEQFKPGGRIERGAGRWLQQFRNTVLPYSTHWMFQIGTEAALRSALAGVFNPGYVADAKKLYEHLSKTEAGRAAAAEMTGSTFYGQRGALGIYHSPNPVLRTAQTTIGTRNLIAAHKLYVDRVGQAMYGLEHNARLAGLGKLMHDHAAEMRQFGKGWQGALRLEGQIIERIAHDLEASPALVAKFGRKIDDLFGQYGKYSPTTRALIQSVAPFLPWYLTATKYVFWQLPIHHPISSALLASLRTTVAQDVQDGQKQPLNAYATQAFGTLSPFGIFTPKSGKFSDVAAELAQKGTSVMLPQVSGAYNALVGRDPFGNQLKGPGGPVAPWSLPAIGQAGNALAEAGFPLLTKARQVREGGRPSYGTSSIVMPQPKPGGGPGNLSQILNRTLNPLYSLQRAQKAKPGGSSRGGGSGFGSAGFGSSGFGSTSLR
jgi:hypothetical protein